MEVAPDTFTLSPSTSILTFEASRPCLSSSFFSSSAGAALASLPRKIDAPTFLVARPAAVGETSCRRPTRRVTEWGKAAPRRRASEVASVRRESRHDESGSLARGGFARARPLSAMLRRGSAVRLSAQTGSVDSRPRLLLLQRISLGSAAVGVAHSDAEVWLLRLPPASGRRLAAGRRVRVKAETCRGGRPFLLKPEGRLRRSNAANASRLLSSTRLMPTAEAATPRSFVQSRRTGSSNSQSRPSATRQCARGRRPSRRSQSSLRRLKASTGLERRKH